MADYRFHRLSAQPRSGIGNRALKHATTRSNINRFDIAIAHQMHLIKHIADNADMVRDDFNPLANLERLYRGIKMQDAMLFRKRFDRDIGMPNDLAISFKAQQIRCQDL